MNDLALMDGVSVTPPVDVNTIKLDGNRLLTALGFYFFLLFFKFYFIFVVVVVVVDDDAAAAAAAVV